MYGLICIFLSIKTSMVNMYDSSLRELEKIVNLLISDICSKNTGPGTSSNIEVIEEIAEVVTTKNDQPTSRSFNIENSMDPFDISAPEEYEAEEVSSGGRQDVNASQDREETAGSNEAEEPQGPERVSSQSASKRKIKCNRCEKDLGSVTALKRHVATYHATSNHQCETCQRFFASA